MVIFMKKLTDNEIRTQIVEIADALYKKGMVNSYEGNVSYNDNGRVYITPSQVCKGYLKNEMIVVVDMDGNVIEANEGYNVSSEVKMHLACYKLRKEIRAVVHTHSPYATAYAVANKPVTTKAYPEMLIVFGQIPLAKYGTPSTDDIHAGFADIINDDYDVFLIANHGIISIGGDLFDAFFRIEAAENIAKVLTITKQLGGEKELPEDELELLSGVRKDFVKKLRNTRQKSI